MKTRIFKVVKGYNDRPFTLVFGSTTTNPNGKREEIEEGEILYFDQEANNGNVWFYHDGNRGKSESGSLDNMLKAGVIKETIDRHSLTAETLSKLITHTGFRDWKDSSYMNDLCDSLILELPNDYSIQVWVPNSLESDQSGDDIATYAYTMENNNTDGSPIVDNYPVFATYEDMLPSLQLLLAYHSSLYPSL